MFDPMLKFFLKIVLFQNLKALLNLLYYFSLYLFILVPVRLFFSYILPPILTYVWHNGSYLHLAQDDVPVYEGIKLIGKGVSYGEHPRETFDVIIPSPNENVFERSRSHFFWILAKTFLDLVLCYPRAVLANLLPRWFGFSNNAASLARNYPAILFVHGGGYCAIDPAIQHHQCTAFARNGFAVYMMQYPWAPEDPHPQQLISALKILNWMKTNHGHENVALIGESAGGNLVTMCAAILSNPEALKQFGAVSGVSYYKDDFPSISSVSSWYGILDQQSWIGKGWLSWGLKLTVDCHARRLPDCDFLTISECFERGWILKFPKLLLISGTTDPLGLVHSSRVAFKKLSTITKVKLTEYEAGHAFIGLNPFILYVLQGSKWRSLGLSATKETIEFVKRGFLLEEVN